MSDREPLMRCRNIWDGVKTGVLTWLQDKHGVEPAYCPCGTRHRGGVNVIQALVWNVGTLHVMVRENPISEDHEGGKYRCT
jgi:hypothetical protein